jgi:hypothetical protein
MVAYDVEGSVIAVVRITGLDWMLSRGGMRWICIFPERDPAMGGAAGGWGRWYAYAEHGRLFVAESLDSLVTTMASSAEVDPLATGPVSEAAPNAPLLPRTWGYV